MPAWSLILFSLIVQACVGTLVWIEILQLSAANRGRSALPEPIRLNLMGGITIGVVAAMLISLVHLGSPMKAVFTLNNLSDSWLSREILFVLLFAIGVTLAAAMQWRGWGSQTTLTVVSVASALVGLALVYAMARLYMLPTTPSWNSLATPVSFYATSLILGGIIVLTALARSVNGSARQSQTLEIEERGERLLVFALLVCLGVEIVLAPFLAGILSRHPMAGYANGATALNVMMMVRLLMVAATSLILLRLLWSPQLRRNRWITAAIILVLVAEVLGRYVFYASYYRIGV